MKRSGVYSGTAAAAAMLLLILDSKTALLGAVEGIDLCIRTVIPSLFPFFVLSSILTGSLIGRNFPFLRPLGRLTGIPAGGESILLTGLLGGYPIGIRSISQALRQNSLRSADARRMAAFCNNAGPSFIFGIAAAMFPKPWMAWALWGIHIASALFVGWLLPSGSVDKIRQPASEPPSIAAAVPAAAKTMAAVCGWVVLFRVILAFLDRWFLWLLPVEAQVILIGVLELTNGCCSLGSIDNTGLRFAACSGMLALGGLCVAMQTAAVGEGIDLSLYFPGKILQCVVSILLALVIQSFFPVEMQLSVHPAIPLILLFSLAAIRIFRKKEKSCSIPAAVRV